MFEAATAWPNPFHWSAEAAVEAAVGWHEASRNCRRCQPLHGVAIAERIRQVTSGTFVVLPGSLFPALHRLEQEAWIAGQWTTNNQKRRVKSYRLTAAGRRQLSAEKREWARIVTAMAQVLETS